ncbi:hypothetical protein QZQ15_05765 [Serratia marcescens]|uniref:hypothetical protein n=1 Tax=Serratia marcescens TaxID=615 RepID=UPI00278F9646|nr:hypothetical protein [Serratia marcescens]MDP8797503.1 hypothetical protein [Serratia marcescens]
MKQTLTTERLKALLDELKSWQYGYCPVDDKEQFDMLATAEWAVIELLANREAQPVMWAHERKLSTDVAITRDEVVAAAWKSEGLTVTPLYTAPPAPANAQPVALVDRRPAASGSICWQNGGKDLPHGTELFTAPPAPASAKAVGYFVRHRSVWDKEIMWKPWTECSAEDYAEYCKQIATGEANAGRFFEARILYDAPAPAVQEEISSAIRHLKDTLVACNRFNYCADAVNRVEDACRAAMLAQPVSSGYTLPPHVYRELVNSLRDTAVKFSGTGQLRERLNTALSQFIEPDHPHTRTDAPDGGDDA